MLQQTLAVFLVVGLLLAALWLLQRKGLATLNLIAGSKGLGRSGRERRRLRVVERVVLTPQHALHLVALDDRFILFATSPRGCRTVSAAGLPKAGDEMLAKASDGMTDRSCQSGAAC